MAETENLPQAEFRLSQIDLGALTRYAAFSGGLAYATGMLSINIYLHQVGVTDFSLAKPKLILTGVLILLTFLLLAIFPVFFAEWISGRRAVGGPTLSPSKGFVCLLLFPLFLLIAASACLCFRSPGEGQILVWRVWEGIHANRQTVYNRTLATLAIAAAVYLPICIGAVSAFSAARLFHRSKQATTASQIVPERLHFPLALSVAVISIIGYMCVFSLTFYPAIPPAFGGGQPYQESFVIAEAQRCEWQQLGIPFIDERFNATAPLPVLHESDALVAVWLPADDPEKWRPILVQLDKNQITAARIVDLSAKQLPILHSLPARCRASLSSAAAKNP